MTRSEARAITKSFMRGYQPPPTCGHVFTRWFGLIFRWRSCTACGWVEGSVSRG
jgi:hypothetical protein